MTKHRNVDESPNRQPAIAHTDPHLALLHEVGQVLAHASSGRDALSLVVERVCTELQWEYGACWKKDEQTHHLDCIHTWHVAALDGSEFVRLSQSTSFEPGAGGLLRTALKNRMPLLVEDISAMPAFRRAQPTRP